MENNNLLGASLHQRKATKKANKSKKNKPIKVVYISNPMKVKTSASQFRALVQELTGQDAELPDPTKFQGSDGGDQTVLSDPMMGDHEHSQVVPVVDPGLEQPQRNLGYEFEPLDDVFTPQMIESLSGLLPTSVFYESSQVDVLRRLDAV